MHHLWGNLSPPVTQTGHICQKGERKYASKRIVLIHLSEISTMEGVLGMSPLLRKMRGTVIMHQEVHITILIKGAQTTKHTAHIRGNHPRYIPILIHTRIPEPHLQ